MYKINERLLTAYTKYTNLNILYRYICGLNQWNEEISSPLKLRIEEHWREKLKNGSFKENDNSKEKYYVLPMFPYPSGVLHMGHVRVYTISDTVARYQRMTGKNVIHPMGWDAFGLPAENAAIQRNIPPNEWTENNIKQMKSSLQELGCSFDWDREITTCHPSYYKWTQDLFLKLFHDDLVYQKEALVNWDPIDETVLADEQVDENGCSWRSGAKVEKKLLKQWFIRTTRFAKDLLEGLDDPTLEEWRDIIKLQKHWIGECDGVNFDFKIDGSGDFLTLWTAQPEYIDNVKFVAISVNHMLVKQNNVDYNGGTVKLNIELVHPFSGEKIPVFVSDEIEFAPDLDYFIGIPSVSDDASEFATNHEIGYKPVDILNNEAELIQIREQICEKAKKLKVGGYWSSAKLRDWLISRQRYWGTPIPIIHCEKCGAQPAPHKDLPITLPERKNGAKTLLENSEWLNTCCPKCGGNAKRETDTMDTFVDSSWYYLRYLDSKNDKEMFNVDKVKKTVPVDLYIGGKEHAVLHLYYARFINHFLHSLGMVPEREPFKRLLVQGMVMGRSFRIKGTGQYVKPEDVDVIDLKRNKAALKVTGEPVVVTWEKMSKSKLNGVDPGDMFKEYGTDTTRLLILADVAPTSHRNWNSNTFPGVLNWQKRIWLTIQDFLRHRNNPPPPIPDDQFKVHEDYMFDSRNYYIKGATFNYSISQQLSIAVSKQQGLTNSLRRAPHAIVASSLQYERALAAQIILLAPMAPFFASELWSGFTSAPNRLNNTGEIDWDKTVLEQKWPETDMNYNLDLTCQINGNEKCIVKLPRHQIDILTKEQALEIAIKEPKISSILCKWKMLDYSLKTYIGIESVLNIKTGEAKSSQLENVKEMKN